MKDATSKNKKRIIRKKKFSFENRGTGERPRFAVFRSNKFLFAQLIDDQKGVTIVGKRTQGKGTADGKKLGWEIAKEAQAKHIKTVVFDRSGYQYHGVIKAIADAAREGGLQF